MATVIGVSIDEIQENVVYASKEVNQNFDVGITGNSEKFKAEFAYEMARITSQIVAAPAGSPENFKMEFSYATAQVTAKVMPMLPSGARGEFAYKMAQITAKIVSAQNLDVEKAKAEFAYEIAQLTTKIIAKGANLATNQEMMVTAHNDYLAPQGTLLRNNADIGQQATISVKNMDIVQPQPLRTATVSTETYTGLIDELMHVGEGKIRTDHKVNISGEVRVDYALNSSPGQWGENSSTLRLRLGLDAALNQDWHVYSMVEGKKSLVNSDTTLRLSDIYVTRKLGQSMMTMGTFGYLMAEGNIYDSAFKGIKYDTSGPVSYTLSYGSTDYTKNTYIATAKYKDFDYNGEASVYHYQTNDGVQNTIGTLGGNYNYSNFGVGGMVLHSTRKDGNGNNTGYVFSLNYGELKTYRPGTYGIFAKYYNQPSGTYIAHGMNGRGSAMQGFRGYGLGINYTIAENFVAGIEHYDLTDKITGEKGRTWWSQVTHYF